MTRIDPKRDKGINVNVVSMLLAVFLKIWNVSVLLLYCVWRYVTNARAALASYAPKFLWNQDTHDGAPITMHKRNKLPLIKIMTAVKGIPICTVVKDTMQGWWCEDNADDEIVHDNATTYVHLGATYITEYHKRCGRRRWQARQSENGWYSKKMQKTWMIL